jgi:RNA polymerase sigma-70 factor (ECF subfamily)
VARNRAIDRLRRKDNEAVKVRQAATGDPAPWVVGDDNLPGAPDGTGPAGIDEDDHDDSGIEDDRLRLIFTCCHPALPLEARVALTLRTLTGLTTAETARALLVSEATMAKRLTRAKSKIQAAGIPYRVPPAHLLPERLTGVLAVLYLLFNEGYSASAGDDLIRENLCREAISLARVLARLMPEEPETAGLLALMLLHDARRATRLDAHGDLVTLEDQDRGRWDHAAVAEGVRILDDALTRGRPGPYQIQAAIAACHATAAKADDVDWPQIALLYGRLAELTPSAVVELNRAVAVAMAHGPQAGLDHLDRIDHDGALAGYHLLPATRADLLRRLGRHQAAREAYQEALRGAPTEAERRFLRKRIAELDDAP